MAFEDGTDFAHDSLRFTLHGLTFFKLLLAEKTLLLHNLEQLVNFSGGTHGSAVDDVVKVRNDMRVLG